MKRKIIIFTGTRAEYGLMRRLIKILSRDESVELRLLVSGSHLSAKYGHTLDEIASDNYAPVDTVAIPLEDNTAAGISAATGMGVAKYGEYMAQTRPDIVVVLGDRYEAFAAAAACALNSIPVAHLYGGELTQGAIDDSLRHAITKMAHLHFTSCERYRQRVIQMGEDAQKVWHVGSLGVENAHAIRLADAQSAHRMLDLPENAKYIVATWHPETLVKGDPVKEVCMLLDSLQHFPDLFYVFTGANADAGGGSINHMLEDRAEKDKQLRFFMSLGAEGYINAVAHCQAVIGNSSSGIIEVPSLGIPVLDIGSRQKGRERPETVWHCELVAEELEAGLKQVLSHAARSLAASTASPFDKPGTAASIARTLAGIRLEGLCAKQFRDMSGF